MHRHTTQTIRRVEGKKAKNKEGQMWQRLAELNGEFKKIKGSKKEDTKKTSKMILYIVVNRYFNDFLL